MIPPGYLLRCRIDSDDPFLLEIENRAAELFRAHGYPQIADEPLASLADLHAMMEGQSVRVAATDAGEPVGFAVAGPVGRFLHLRELSVDPAHGRRGLGAALVCAVAEEGEAAGWEGVTLTTFRSVPFNQPFYERLGFAELPLDRAAPSALQALFAREVPEGIDPAQRVLMFRRSALTVG